MERVIDISSNNTINDFQAIKDAGYAGVLIKATDGLTYTNPDLISSYKGAKAVGLKTGFYHFAERNDPTAEFNHFKTAIAGLIQNYKPSLDYEVSGNPDYEFIKRFMAMDNDLIYYGSHSTADNTGLPKSKIWVAEPDTNPVDTRGYAGIQYNWKAHLTGATGDVDVDLIDENLFNIKTNEHNTFPMELKVVSVTGRKQQAPIYCLSYYSDVKSGHTFKVGEQISTYNIGDTFEAIGSIPGYWIVQYGVLTVMVPAGQTAYID